jgi:hypothetical protein
MLEKFAAVECYVWGKIAQRGVANDDVNKDFSNPTLLELLRILTLRCLF